MGLKGIANL